MRIYVGNLPFSTDATQLRELFEAHGEVVGASIVQDRETGRSRGFGFIEMADAEAGRAAMSALDGQEIQGRSLKVNEARPRGERPPRGDRPPRGPRPPRGDGRRGPDGGGGGYRGRGGDAGRSSGRDFRERGGGGSGRGGPSGGYGRPAWQEMPDPNNEGRGRNKHARREMEREKRRQREDDYDDW